MSAPARTVAAPALTEAATALTRRLARPTTQLGVFLPARFPFPSSRTDAHALCHFAARGADILEIGIPHHDAVYDGPLIQEAYREALRQGTGVRDVLETVHLATAHSSASVVVMTYWDPIRAYGPARFARHLAAAGGAGAMVVDLPEEAFASWSTATREAGIHAPHLVSRAASDTELQRAATTATGWLYAPAADALTGYTGPLDVAALDSFTRRLHQPGWAPVVTGIGISTPEKARQVRHMVSGVVIGTPVVRAFHDLGPHKGLETAGDQVEAFALALRH
jgi:tryptophan synthase alpha chain